MDYVLPENFIKTYKEIKWQKKQKQNYTLIT